MLKFTLKRLLRVPIPAIAVILFAAILSTVLCGTQAASVEDRTEYQQICDAIPVNVYVSNLSGTAVDNIAAPRWAMDAVRLFLEDHVKDLQGKATLDIDRLTVGEVTFNDKALVGITSLSVAGELAQGSQELVKWIDGVEESALQGGEMVCILPKSMVPDGTQLPFEIQLHFESMKYNSKLTKNEKIKVDRTFKVVGVHGNNSGIYCPLAVVESLYARLERELTYDRIQGVLIENFAIQELYDAASKWFVKPNLSGERTPWNKNGYSYYPFALKVDDSQLRAAAEALQNSLTINEICTALTFALSAASGFFIGFLMIRARKREIALMRTMGTPKLKIYGGFALEQLLCAVLGTVLGGAYFLWQPPEQLAAFVGIYFAGLSIALLIFLSTKLITTIKEDE